MLRAIDSHGRLSTLAKPMTRSASTPFYGIRRTFVILVLPTYGTERCYFTRNSNMTELFQIGLNTFSKHLTRGKTGLCLLSVRDCEKMLMEMFLKFCCFILFHKLLRCNIILRFYSQRSTLYLTFLYTPC